MALELKLAGDAIYKQPVNRVETVTDEVKATVAELLRALHDYQAMGIAAPMFGIPLAIILLEVNASPIAMLNPEIIHASAERQIVEEGSLPYPGASAQIERAASVTVKYMDITGTEQTREFSGIDAACVQHEMDYLEGKSFIDHLSRLKQDMLMRKVQKNIRAGHVPHVHSELCSH